MIPSAVTGVPRIDPMMTRPMPVVDLRCETQDVFTLSLDVSGCEQGFPFRPGQFTMLYLFGAGEVPISISGSAARPMILTHTIRAVGGVTTSLQKLKPGAVLGVRGPFGTGWPIESASGMDVLIIAGGVGLAPLRPLIYHLLEHRNECGHISLFYGARSPDDILFRRELERWGGRFDMDVSVIVDHAITAWNGNVGVVTTQLEKARCEPGRTLAMICGPEIMMRYAVRELNQLGVTDGRIYVSMERNMQCAVGYCGHCQYGPTFVCRDGPVFRLDRIKPVFGIREV